MGAGGIGEVFVGVNGAGGIGEVFVGVNGGWVNWRNIYGGDWGLGGLGAR